jgi:uncharacterized membrane protein YgdD (TMEM256/DUF423 family)
MAKEVVVTTKRLALCDTFIKFFLLTAAVCAVYGVLTGAYPFNALVAAVGSNVGMAVLTACLRMQIDDIHAPQFALKGQLVNKGRAYIDYVMCSAVLIFVGVHYMG